MINSSFRTFLRLLVLLLIPAVSGGCIVAGAVAAGAIVGGSAGEAHKLYSNPVEDCRQAAKDVLAEMKIGLQKEIDVQYDARSADDRKVRVQFRKEGEKACTVYFRIGFSGDDKVNQQFFSKMDRKLGAP